MDKKRYKVAVKFIYDGYIFVDAINKSAAVDAVELNVSHCNGDVQVQPGCDEQFPDWSVDVHALTVADLNLTTIVDEKEGCHE